MVDVVGEGVVNANKVIIIKILKMYRKQIHCPLTRYLRLQYALSIRQDTVSSTDTRHLRTVPASGRRG